jgi:hypothetical protein
VVKLQIAQYSPLFSKRVSGTPSRVRFQPHGWAALRAYLLPLISRAAFSVGLISLVDEKVEIGNF